jgi:hypothetical protein
MASGSPRHNLLIGAAGRGAGAAPSCAASNYRSSSTSASSAGGERYVYARTPSWQVQIEGIELSPRQTGRPAQVLSR